MRTLTAADGTVLQRVRNQVIVARPEGIETRAVRQLM